MRQGGTPDPNASGDPPAQGEAAPIYYQTEDGGLIEVPQGAAGQEVLYQFQTQADGITLYRAEAKEAGGGEPSKKTEPEKSGK